MPRKAFSLFVRYFLGTFITVFGIVWLLLEPLGGLDYVITIKNQKIVFYLILIILSSLISTIIYNRKTHGEELAQTAKEKGPFAAAGEDRSTFNYLQLMREARHSVDLLGLSLAPFATEQYINTLYRLLEQSVRIRIILANPLSPNLAQRHKALYSVNEDVQNATAVTLKTLMRLKRSIGSLKKELLLVRVMNILPHYGLFKVDDTILCNPYLAKRTGLGSPYFVVQENSIWADFLGQDFEVLLNEYSFRIDEDTSVEILRDYLREDHLIYDKYGDEETMNRLRPFLT